jgi:hypothetical protein
VGNAAAHPLVEAALAADPRDGWSKLLELLAVADGSVAQGVQLQVLQGLMGLLPAGEAPVSPGWSAVKEFSLDAEIAALLPKDSAAQLAGALIVVLKRWQPDATKGGFDAGLNSLINLANRLPKQEPGSEIPAALAGIKERLAGTPNAKHYQQSIDRLVAQLTGKEGPKAAPDTGKGVPPPKPPGDF